MDKEKLYEKIKLKQSFEYKGRVYEWCNIHETYEYNDGFGDRIAVNIEDIIKEDKKIKKFKVIKDNSGDSVQLIYDGMKLELTLLQAIILDKLNEIIDRLNGE